MKKMSIMAVAVAAAGLASCTAQAPKANLKSEIDSLSYMIGVSNTRGLDMYITQQLGVDSAYIADFIKGVKEGAAKTGDKANDAYLAGLQIGHQVSGMMYDGINQRIFQGDSTMSLSKSDFLAGFIETLEKKNVIDTEVASDGVQVKIEAIQRKALEAKYADNKKAGEDFLAENAKKEGVITLPSGLQYKVITEGKGAVPADSNVVSVNYRGTLVDGTEFDSSYKRNEPFKTHVKQVIKGWTEALQLMPVGSKWELYIPYDLAYGSRETGGQIKPFSALIFEIELLGIEK
jgi:FKBP-type peptidyl-prolyl cis-trans isomerase FklB